MRTSVFTMIIVVVLVVFTTIGPVMAQVTLEEDGTVNILNDMTVNGFLELNGSLSVMDIWVNGDLSIPNKIDLYGDNYIEQGEASLERVGIDLSGPTSDVGLRVNPHAYPGEETTMHGIEAKADVGDFLNVGVHGEAEDGQYANRGISGSVNGIGYAGYFSGDVYVSGGITESSDERLKQNIQTLDASEMLNLVNKLQPRSYRNLSEEELERQHELPNLNMSEGNQLGLVAQELEEVFPDLVSEVTHVLSEREELAEGQEPETTTTKAVDYNGLIVALIAAMQEQQAQIEELKEEIGN